jgi:hypothetical protein
MGEIVTFESPSATTEGYAALPESVSGTGAVRGIEGAGGEVEVFDYPGTKHAFFNDERPHVHDAEAADQAWARTVGFLHKHLG